MPKAALSARFQGIEIPSEVSHTPHALPVFCSGGWTTSFSFPFAPNSTPPFQNTRQKDSPLPTDSLTNCSVAAHSPAVKMIIKSIHTAVAKHQVHHAPTTTGWRMIN